MFQKYKTCQLGFHDKVEVKSFVCNNYIKKQMENNSYFTAEKTPFITARKTPLEIHYLVDFHFRYVFAEIYGHNNMHGANPKLVNDYVCIKCHKCFNNIDFEKKMIKIHVDEYVKQMENNKIRKQIANDLYREKCNEEPR